MAGGQKGKRGGRVTHGMTGTKEWNAWMGMKARCRDPKKSRWYGSVRVCARWRRSFPAFYKDVGPAPTVMHSLDRYPDVLGNYKPGNVRWATWHQQRTNRHVLKACRKAGHLYTGKNTIWATTHGRPCRLCRTCTERLTWRQQARRRTPAGRERYNAWQREYRRRKREETDG